MNFRNIVIASAGAILAGGALLSLGSGDECRIISEATITDSPTQIRVIGTSNCESGAVSIDAMGQKTIARLHNYLFSVAVQHDGENIISVSDGLE